MKRILIALSLILIILGIYFSAVATTCSVLLYRVHSFLFVYMLLVRY